MQLTFFLIQISVFMYVLVLKQYNFFKNKERNKVVGNFLKWQEHWFEIFFDFPCKGHVKFCKFNNLRKTFCVYTNPTGYAWKVVPVRELFLCQGIFSLSGKYVFSGKLFLLPLKSPKWEKFAWIKYSLILRKTWMVFLSFSAKIRLSWGWGYIYIYIYE